MASPEKSSVSYGEIWKQIKIAVMFLIGVVLLVAGPFDLLVEGPFSWHVRQPAAWQGGLELIVLGGFATFVVYLLDGFRRWLALMALVAVYARRHGFDLDMLVVLIYLESMTALGLAAMRGTSRLSKHSPESVALAAGLGIVLWSACMWLVSIAGLGSLRAIHVLAVVVLLPGLILAWRMPITSMLIRSMRPRSWSDSVFAGFLVVAVCMLFAKARVSLGFDSAWYGLRGDRVLVGGGSVFDGMGLVSPVHYYPKVYEMLLLPMTGWGSITAIAGVAIAAWAILGLISYAIGKRLGWPRTRGLAAAAAVLSTPAMMNIALTAKGGLAAACMILLAVYSGIRFQDSRDRGWLVMFASFLLIAPMMRLSVLPYVAALGCAWMFMVLWSVSKESVAEGAETSVLGHLPLLILAAALIVLVLAEARTFTLTGMPIISPRFLVGWEESLGFRLHDTIGLTLSRKHTAKLPVPILLLDFLARPARLPQVQIYWTGAIWAACLAMAWMGSGWRCTGRNMPWLLILPAAAFFLVIGIKHFGVSGGDGNYYVAPVACLVLLGLHAIGEDYERPGVIGGGLRWLIAAFVCVGLAVSLVTGLWGPGTTRLDWNFTRSPFDYKERARVILKRRGLMDIDRYLSSYAPDTRAVGLLYATSGTWLPIRYESLQFVSLFRRPLVESVADVQQFLQRDRIRFVIVPHRLRGRREQWLGPILLKALEGLAVTHCAQPVLPGKRYVVWEIRGKSCTAHASR